MQGYALWLFRYLFVAEIAWLALRMAFKRASLNDTLMEFIRVLIVVGFMYCVLVYYDVWIEKMVTGIGVSYDPEFKSNSPEMKILNSLLMGIYTTFVDFELSLTLIPQAFCVLIISISVALLLVVIITVIAESYLALNIGVILLGFGSFSFTREFTINYIKYMLGVGLKLLTMKILATVLNQILNQPNSPIAVIQNSDATFMDYVYVVMSVLIITGLFKTIPGVVASLVSHASMHSGSGAVMAAGFGAIAGSKLATQAGGKATSAAGGAANTAGSALSKAANAAGGLATAAGMPGVGAALKGAGTAASMAGKTAGTAGQAAGAAMQGRLGNAASIVHSSAKGAGNAVKGAYQNHQNAKEPGAGLAADRDNWLANRGKN